MEIEYAKKITDHEQTLFFNRIKNSYKINDTSKDFIEANKDKLIEAYNKFKESFEIEFKEIKNEYNTYLIAYESKKCICGSELVFIKSHGFYGCVNYKTNTKHKNFMDYPLPVMRNPSRVGAYLTDIIVSLGQKGKLNAKSLYYFYNDLGFEDLLYKYGRKYYLEQIETYTNVNKNSKHFEKKCFERCQPLYYNCFREFGIKYKLKGEKEKYCFIDILCSNEKEIHIYECKTSKGCESQEQNDLYFSLIRFIDGSKRDTKIINLFDKENSGFEIIEQRELLIKQGLQLL